MAELKTKPTGDSVNKFLDNITDTQKRQDSQTVCNIMQKATGEQPKLWGTSMVGFGSYHYKYASGREGDWFMVGFSPRKQNLTLYIMDGFENYHELLNRLGKYSTGKSCLYVKNLEDIDLKVLRKLISQSVQHMRKTYQ